MNCKREDGFSYFAFVCISMLLEPLHVLAIDVDGVSGPGGGEVPFVFFSYESWPHLTLSQAPQRRHTTLERTKLLVVSAAATLPNYYCIALETSITLPRAVRGFEVACSGNVTVTFSIAFFAFCIGGDFYPP